MLENNANNQHWRGECAVDSVSHEYHGGGYVTTKSYHSCEIENKTDRKRVWNFHYSHRIDKAIAVDNNGNPTQWQNNVFDASIDKGWDIKKGATVDHHDAAEEPVPNIDYFRSRTFAYERDTWYRVRVYTLIKPPGGNAPDFGPDIEERWTPHYQFKTPA